MTATKRFLAKGGIGLLSLKAASERHQDGNETEVFSKAYNQLEEHVDVLEHINLTGFEDQHALFVIRMR